MKSIKKIVSLALATFIFALSIPTFTSVSFAFSDVSSSHKYYYEIDYLDSLGLLPDTLENKFEPDEPVTPADLYSMILAYAGAEIVDQNEVNLPFTDTVNDAWYSPYIQTALNLNVLKTSLFNPEFKPDRSMRKREVLMVLFDSLGIGVNKLFNKNYFQYTDLNPEGDFAPYAYKAYELGIIETDKPTLARGAKVITKAEAANMVYLIDQYSYGNSVYIDIGSNSVNDVDYDNFEVLKDVWNTIQNSYYYQDEIDEETMLYDAIHAIVDTLQDPYTIFSTPDENSTVEILDSEYEGVGMSIEMTDDEIIVISPFKDSPAEAAGILPNDIITKIDGKSVDGLSLETAVNMIKGEAGTDVELTIKRGSKTLEITVIRGYIFYSTATLEYLEQTNGAIAYINLVTFGEETFGEFLGIAQQIHDKQETDGNVLGIILDLRNNPGGYLDVAIDLNGFFFDENKKAVILENSSGTQTSYYSEYYGEEDEYPYGAGLLADYEVSVLINEGSASASEILAGALQDYNRAEIIGEKSFGKGTVQELLFYQDDSIFKLTVSKWLTPNKRDINGKGLTPDKRVSNSGVTTDNQLEEAVAELLE